MAQSLEYPDLKWVPPKAFGSGRDGKAVRFIVIHYTAGSERSTSAEDGAAYDARRTDGTSTHYFHDSNSTVQCVHTRDRANTARHRGNRLGVQHELCGTAQTRAQWLDAASSATLRIAARQVARDCRKYDIPVRRLSVAETRRAWTEFPNGPRGIVGHVDCTEAFPEDHGDHTDPGKDFPWDILLAMVRDEMEEDEMNDADRKWITSEFTRIVDARADAIAEEVLVKARFAWSADDPTATSGPASYQRNLGDLAGDAWAAIMRGTTRGGSPLPAAGAFGQINAKLDELNGRINDIDDASVVTKDEVLAALRAEIRAIVRDGVA